MDFAQQQRNPAKHLVGIIFVILFHVLLVYALINGLANRVVDVIKAPLEAKIVEEVKPPPPPEIKLPPPPKMVAPPPPYIPPPEVAIQTPVVNTVTTTTVAPPVTAFVPTAPPSTAPAPAQPAVKNVGTACPNVSTVKNQVEYPVKALRAGVNEGEVNVRFVVAPNGEIKDIAVASSTNRLFNDTAINAVKLLKCSGSPQDQAVTWDIAFRAE